ncbi:alpha/beta hydrolase [Collimonas sp.]|jgi:esterase/lipase superfamily enzyme|uniref:alpha/beta hydrolase n=1 Tax=Collimonas sp. TaxID=1963772 RepID=UPI002C2A67A1|nr:alpha/beta hydrolase [Collimonas sp.]HWW07411.1 alpha/beta hydrolase [Collimonas sp.]
MRRKLFSAVVCGGFSFILASCATSSSPSLALSSYKPIPPEGIQLPTEAETTIDYSLFYATTRKPLQTGAPRSTVPYAASRDPEFHQGPSELNYGTLVVHVPKHHQTGSTGSLIGDITGQDPSLTVSRIQPYADESTFLHNVAIHMHDAVDLDAVVVYIHGFNNSFEQSALRAGQLGVDLGIPQYRMFLFNWPSAASTASIVHGYFMDEAAIDASEAYLAKYLTQIASLANGRKIHVVAHSMGNRALLRVVAGALHDAAVNNAIHFGQIILAAPDVDAEVFHALAPAYLDISDQTTVYLSPFDKAVHLSEAVHDYPRVGCGNAPIFPVKHIDYVVSYINVDLIDIGHAYFAQATPFLADMKSLIFHGQSIRANAPWHPKKGYWVVGESLPAPNSVDRWGCEIIQTTTIGAP